MPKTTVCYCLCFHGGDTASEVLARYFPFYQSRKSLLAQIQVYLFLTFYILASDLVAVISISLSLPFSPNLHSPSRHLIEKTEPISRTPCYSTNVYFSMSTVLGVRRAGPGTRLYCRQTQNMTLHLCSLICKS